MLGYSVASAADLTSWSALDLDSATQPGSWQVSAGEARQTFNSGPTAWLSPVSQHDVKITGTLRVETTVDDDFIGFIVGFNNSADYLLVDWKKMAQLNAQVGMRLVRVTQPLTGNSEFFAPHTTGKAQLLASNTSIGPWQYNQTYQFEVDITSTRLIVKIDGQPVLNATGNFSPGRFGLYSYSQEQTVFSSVAVSGSVVAAEALQRIKDAADANDTSAISYTDINTVAGVTGAIAANQADYQNAIASLTGAGVTPASLQSLVDGINNNTAPEANAGGPYVSDEGNGLILDGSNSTDADGSIVSWEWDLDDDGAYDDASGATVDLGVQPDGPAAFPVSLRVSDNHGAMDIVDTMVTVNNVAPVAQTQNLTLAEDGSLAITLSASDVPADILNYSVETQPANGVLSGTAPNLVYVPAADFSGTDSFSFTASDDDGGVSAFATINLSVGSEPDAPYISAIADQILDEDSSLSDLAFSVGDVDGDAVSIASVSSDNTALVSNEAIQASCITGNCSLSLTPQANANGVAMITVTVSDGTGRTASDSFSLTVNPVNDAPAFTQTGDVTVDEDFTSAQTVTVTPQAVPADEAGQAVTYSLVPTSVAFADIDFDSDTGEVIINAVENGHGSQLFSLTADDGQASNNLAMDSFTLTVNSVNDDPVVSTPADVEIDRNTSTGSISVSLSDVETAVSDLLLTVSTNNEGLFPPANITTEGSDGNRTVTLVPAADQVGSATVTLTVTDGQTGSASSTFTVAVIVPDSDGDGLDDDLDNCPLTPNAGQENLDGDEFGDACDSDRDGDGIDNDTELSGGTNPDNADSDGDGIDDGADAFPNDNSESSDSDGDGVGDNADAFANNPNASQDSDGDGLPEDCTGDCGGLTADPFPDDGDNDGLPDDEDDIVGDNNPPVVSAPADIALDASGDLTTVNLGQATAVDARDGVINPVNPDTPDAQTTLELPPGHHVISWSAEDIAGNVGTAEQVIDITPLAGFETDSQTVGEGSLVSVVVTLNGDAVSYPVTIPLELDVTSTALNPDDHDGETHTITIEADAEPANTGIYQFVVGDDGLTGEADETVIFNLVENNTLDSLAGAVLDTARDRHVVTATEVNVAPELNSLSVIRGEEVLFVADAEAETSTTPAYVARGSVLLLADLTDANPEDSHTFSWEVNGRLMDVTSDELPLDLTDLGPGTHTVGVQALDNGNPPDYSNRLEMRVRLVAPAPAASPLPSFDGGSLSLGVLAAGALLGIRRRRRQQR